MLFQPYVVSSNGQERYQSLINEAENERRYQQLKSNQPIAGWQEKFLINTSDFLINAGQRLKSRYQLRPTKTA